MESMLASNTQLHSKLVSVSQFFSRTLYHCSHSLPVTEAMLSIRVSSVSAKMMPPCEIADADPKAEKITEKQHAAMRIDFVNIILIRFTLIPPFHNIIRKSSR